MASTPVSGPSPSACIRSSAQNSSWMERRNAHTTRTARTRGKTRASRKPPALPSPTPSTAKATVFARLRASIAMTSGAISPRSSRSISAQGCAALTARSASASALMPSSTNTPVTWV